MNTPENSGNFFCRAVVKIPRPLSHYHQTGGSKAAPLEYRTSTNDLKLGDRGSKRPADPVAFDKPGKKAKTEESCKAESGDVQTTAGWWSRLSVKAMLTPWRWFQR